MKKVFTTFLLIIVLCIVLISCNVPSSNDTDINTESKVNTDDTNKNTNVSENPDSDNTNNDSNTNESGTNTEKSEFPFDNIIVERNGYDIVAAGKYYGNDFDSVTDYGSYYRIIDNYEDFSELTQWGNQLDETVFNENFILVLYSYLNCSVYYSHSNFSILNQRGQFGSFGINLYTNKLELFEKWTLSGGALDLDGYVPPKMEDCTVIFPTEKEEIIYLLISKDEITNNLTINGEIELKSEIIELG